MRVECVAIFPDFENREMVGPRRRLLEDVVSQIALVFPALFSHAFEPDLGFIFAWRRHVDMRYHGYRPTRRRPRPGINCEPLMHPLIVGTIVNRLQLRSKLRRGSAFFMCLKGRLVLPEFSDHEVVRPSDFLYDIHPGLTLLSTNRF